MYLGLDQEYDEATSGFEHFKIVYDSVNAGTNRQHEINMMLEKLPLGKYIKDGAAIAGINLDDKSMEKV
ncbi:hypothetical protein D3C74_408000 [compost metagenome]